MEEENFEKNLVDVKQRIDNLKNNINWASDTYNIKLGFMSRLNDINENHSEIAFKFLQRIKIKEEEIKNSKQRIDRLSREYYWSSLEKMFNQLNQEAGGKLKELALPKEVLDEIDIIKEGLESFEKNFETINYSKLENDWKRYLIGITKIKQKVIRKKRAEGLKICIKILYMGAILILAILAYLKGEELPFPRYYLFLALGVIIVVTYYIFGLTEKAKRIIKTLAPPALAILFTLLGSIGFKFIEKFFN